MRWASQVVVKDNEEIASLPREHDAYGQSTVITGVMRTDQKPCLDHSKNIKMLAGKTKWQPGTQQLRRVAGNRTNMCVYGSMR